MPSKKIVLDTNGLISSLSRRGRFYPIWQSFQQRRYTLCISNEILDEYIEVISQKMTPEIAENVADLLLFCHSLAPFSLEGEHQNHKEYTWLF